MQKITQAEHDDAVIERCLEAYLDGGTFDASLDRVATQAGVSKRMLVHYFGSREAVEKKAIALFQERRGTRFEPDAFSSSTLSEAVSTLWERITAAEFRSHLLLIMDLLPRARNGSGQGRAFYEFSVVSVETCRRAYRGRPKIEALLNFCKVPPSPSSSMERPNWVVLLWSE